MKTETVERIAGPAGSSIIYNLMQDQPRKMTTIGIRGLYDNEVTKAQTKKDYITLKPSYVWEDNIQTKRKLNGTCALIVTADYDDEFDINDLLSTIEDAKIYGNCGAIGVLVSEDVTAGEDADEVIMSDARLICVITLKEG